MKRNYEYYKYLFSVTTGLGKFGYLFKKHLVNIYYAPVVLF